MVSKSQILGQYPLIFVTVGTTGFDFNRLFTAVDHSMKKIRTKPFLIVQVGDSKYKWDYENLEKEPSYSPDKLVRIAQSAHKIIAHGGPGSLYLAVRHARYLPLIISRSAKFQEHVDNHQLHFIKFLRNKLPKNLRKYFLIKTEIKKSIEDYLIEESRPNILSDYLFKEIAKNNLMNKLEKYIEKFV